MKSIAFCLLFVVLAVFADDVIVYTADDFDDGIEEHDLILVEFYAPWCGHCKKLAPEYSKAAEKLKFTDPAVPLAKVDCDAHKDLCSKFGVSGYPTLKLFRNGVPTDYAGPRDENGIVNFMLKQAGPVTKEFKSVEEVEKFIGGEDITVVGFFTEDADKKEFEKIAGSLFENFKFGYSLDAAVGEHFEASGTAVLFRPPKFHSKMEDAKVKFEGAFKKGKVEKFIKDNAHGLVGLLTSDNSLDFKKPLLTAFYDVDYAKNLKGTNYWRNRVMKIAKKYVDEKLTFSIASGSDFKGQLEEYGIKNADGSIPVVTITGSGGQKYSMAEEFTRDGSALDAFVTKFLAGELEAYLKSEDIPDENDAPVKVVVAKSFNDIVMDETKDVLIEFYAPWCGHCKSLVPKYDELAETLKGDENIVIAKMDATANDVPEQFEVRGFPTIYWAPMNGKNKPRKYESGREVKDFLSFIKKEATNKPVNVDGKSKDDKTEL